jgi:hypothetical protein
LEGLQGKWCIVDALKHDYSSSMAFKQLPTSSISGIRHGHPWRFASTTNCSNIENRNLHSHDGEAKNSNSQVYLSLVELNVDFNALMAGWDRI